MSTNPRHWVFGALVALSPLVAGCGHSESEWQAQLASYDRLQKTSTEREAALDKELGEAQARVAALEKQLEKEGLEVGRLNASLDDREKALAEYKARAAKLEAVRARFQLLRSKLDELTRFGLAVTIRKNRMVISLPGDVLFDTGKDVLKADGKEILHKVAVVIHNDRSLLGRDYQVAGHTDNRPLASGPFHDNWGLSLMRARAVLLYLVGSGGNMPRDHWSAAGFADTDPVESNATEEGKEKNRRCDLVAIPDVDEVLDLKTLALAPEDSLRSAQAALARAHASRARPRGEHR